MGFMQNITRKKVGITLKKVSLIVIAFALVSTLFACSKEASKSGLSADGIVQAFKDAGLEAENVRDMTDEDFGIAPNKTKEGKRFFIPSLGENSGGRILIYDKTKDLEEMKEFYEALNEASPLFFSWIIAKSNALVVISGDLTEEEYNKYNEAVNKL